MLLLVVLVSVGLGACSRGARFDGVLCGTDGNGEASGTFRIAQGGAGSLGGNLRLADPQGRVTNLAVNGTIGEKQVIDGVAQQRIFLQAGMFSGEGVLQDKTLSARLQGSAGQGFVLNGVAVGAQAFCGQFSGSKHGVWNLVKKDSVVRGVFSGDGLARGFVTGSVSGDRLELRWLSSDGKGGAASGRLGRGLVEGEWRCEKCEEGGKWRSEPGRCPVAN